MPIDHWVTYLVTVLVLMSTPGPSHLLMLSNSIGHGFPRSLATAVGDLTANLLQMLAAGLGLAAALTASATAFAVVKWLGVAYLVWLGLRLMLAGQESIKPDGEAAVLSRRQLWLQGFITSAANPKAVVFFAALFPQFIDQTAPFWPQFATLSVTYLAVDGLFLTGYGIGASWLAERLRRRGRILLNRASGSLLIGAAVLLGIRGTR